MLLSPLRFLPLPPAQLSLAAVLKCGQTFLWRKGKARATLPPEAKVKFEESPRELYEWLYGHVDRTIVLRQDCEHSLAAACSLLIPYG
jgi:N-glycosylase/DNA lyase